MYVFIWLLFRQDLVTFPVLKEKTKRLFLRVVLSLWKIGQKVELFPTGTVHSPSRAQVNTWHRHAAFVKVDGPALTRY